MSSATIRCIQCKWSIAPARVEIVERNGEQIFLHLGGCPQKPKEKSKNG